MASLRIALFLSVNILALPAPLCAMLRSRSALNVKPSLLVSATKSNLLKPSFTPKQHHHSSYKQEQKKNGHQNASGKQKIDKQTFKTSPLSILKNISSFAVNQASTPPSQWSVWGLLALLVLKSDSDEKKTPPNVQEYQKLLTEMYDILGQDEVWWNSAKNAFLERLEKLFTIDPDPRDIDALIATILLAKRPGLNADKLLYNFMVKAACESRKFYKIIHQGFLRNIHQFKKNNAVITLTHLYVLEMKSSIHQASKPPCHADHKELSSLKSYIDQNLCDIANNRIAADLVANHLTSSHVRIAQDLLDTFIHTIVTLDQTSYGTVVLKGMMLSSLSLAQKAKIYDACLEQFEHLSPSFLKTLAQYAPDKNQIDHALIHLPGLDFSSFTKVLAFYKYSTQKPAFTEDNLSQTHKHLLAHLDKLDNAGLEKYHAIPELKDLANNLIAKERELNAHNYYTFIHGQMRQFYFLEKLYTLAWEITTGKTAIDYVFPYLKKPVQFYEQLEDEQQLRKTLLTTYIEDARKGFDPTDTLFTNYGLFANIGNPGSNSADYIANNRNMRPSLLTPGEILSMFKLERVYHAFSFEINQLADDYINLCRQGNALLIAIPKEKINEYAYPARDFGYHITPRKFGLKIKDTKELMELLTDTNLTPTVKYWDGDANTLMFCLPMTFDGALNPQSGIKIFPFITGDAEKLKELQKREKELFEKIKKFAGSKYVKKYRLGSVD